MTLAALACPPVHLLPAAAVEPGDLMLGPGLVEPARIWWRLESPGQVVLLLQGPAAPAELVLPGAAWVALAARPAPGPRWRAEQAARLGCAARGAWWLRATGHTQAPSAGGLTLLVEGYAQLAGISTASARRRVGAGLPSAR